MNDLFRTIPITLHNARTAYPLVYLHDASVSLDKWIQFVHHQCQSPSGETGVIAIHDLRGMIHALFCYRVEIDMHACKRLCLANLLVARVPGNAIDKKIVNSANDLATRLGCVSITLDQPFGRCIGCSYCNEVPSGLPTNTLHPVAGSTRH